MPRASKFDEDQILTAAGRIIATHGPSGATIGAIARAVGAPTGSIYHRFDSRDVVLAKVWLRAAATFQAAFFERLRGSPPRKAASTQRSTWRSACACIPRKRGYCCITDVKISSIAAGPPGCAGRPAELGQQVEAELARFSQRLCGRADARTVSDRGLRGGGGSLRGSAAARLRP